MVLLVFVCFVYTVSANIVSEITSSSLSLNSVNIINKSTRISNLSNNDTYHQIEIENLFSKINSNYASLEKSKNNATQKLNKLNNSYSKISMLNNTNNRLNKLFNIIKEDRNDFLNYSSNNIFLSYNNTKNIVESSNDEKMIDKFINSKSSDVNHEFCFNSIIPLDCSL